MPTKVGDIENVDLWYMKDDKFERPKAFIRAKIYTPDCNLGKNPRGMVFAEVWKKVYDEDEPARAAAGFKEITLYQGLDNPNNVVAIFSNDDVEKAREFLQSDHIKEAMQSAGVVSEPQFIELQ